MVSLNFVSSIICMDKLVWQENFYDACKLLASLVCIVQENVFMYNWWFYSSNVHMATITIAMRYQTLWSGFVVK